MLLTVEIGRKIGQRLDDVMRTQRLTQSEVAARAGVSQPTVSALVGGLTKDPPIGTVLKIADALGLTLDEVIGSKQLPHENHPSRLESIEARVDALAQLPEQVERLSNTLTAILQFQQSAGTQMKSPGRRKQPA